MEACKQHGVDCEREKLCRRIFGCILTVIILILLTILIVWLVLRPAKPRFYLRDVTLTQFNLTAPGFLGVSAQITISSKNPNDRIGIYYDRLDAYAVYKGQQVTVPSALPRGYQGHEDIAVWSPTLYGTAVPVAPYLSDALSQDQSAGVLLVSFRVGGRLRWKVGSWTSGRYHLFVNCPAFMTNVRGAAGVDCYKLQQGMVTCSVDV